MDPEDSQLWEEIKPDLTPLIDGVFLLLIFFMVTMVFARPTHLNIELAEARNPRAVEQQHNHELAITPAGELQLDGVQVAPGQLESGLQALVTEDKEARLTVLVDRRAPHVYTLEAMEAAQAAGLDRVFLATQSRTAEEAP